MKNGPAGPSEAFYAFRRAILIIYAKSLQISIASENRWI